VHVHGFLSIVQTGLLGILRDCDRDRDPSMNEPAKRLNVDKSSVSGMVRRTPDPRDRRSCQISIIPRWRAASSSATSTSSSGARRPSGRPDVRPARVRTGSAVIHVAPVVLRTVSPGTISR
jgi:hypothetical protein